jgi:hypothetical protein
LSGIRPLERDDLEQVAGLFLRVMRPGGRESIPGVAAYLERTTLDHPWAEPAIPALVFADERGNIVGFIGSYVRRMYVDGRRIRAASPGNLVAAPEVRRLAVGALLLRRYINGPQELTFTDTAGERTRRMWQGLGGEVVHLGSLSWVRVFRPCQLGTDRLLERRDGRASKVLLPPLSAAGDAVAGRLARGMLRPEPPRGSAETLTAEAMLAELPELTASMRFYPDYDREYLQWLFEELARPRRRGSLVRRLLRDGDRVLGWYVYYLKPGGISRVLQVVASDRHIGPVIDHLFHDAHRGGAAALDGRVESQLLEALAHRRCILRYSGASLLHSRKREILDAVFSQHGLLTRMDSEYWAAPPRQDRGGAELTPNE